MRHTIDVKGPADCREISDLVYQALHIGFDVEVTTRRPETTGMFKLRQVEVSIIDPPELVARVAEREATDAENRAGLEQTRAALRAVGDPDPETTVAFVGQEAAYEQAQAQHLADGLGLIDNGMPAAYDRAESRNGRRS